MPAASQWLAIHYTTVGQYIQMTFLQMPTHPLLLAHGDDRVVITTQCQVRNSNRRRKHTCYIFRLTKPESLKNNQTNFKLNTGLDGKLMQLYQKLSGRNPWCNRKYESSILVHDEL